MHALAVELDRRGHAVTVVRVGRLAGARPPRGDRADPRSVTRGAAGIHAVPWLMTTPAGRDGRRPSGSTSSTATSTGPGSRWAIARRCPWWRRSTVASTCPDHGSCWRRPAATTWPSAPARRRPTPAAHLGGRGPQRPGPALASPFLADRSDDLCFVGRLMPEKGILEAIEVARRSGRHLRIAAKVGTQPAEVDYYERRRPARHRGRRRRAPGRAVVDRTRPAVRRRATPR